MQLDSPTPTSHDRSTRPLPLRGQLSPTTPGFSPLKGGLSSLHGQNQGQDNGESQRGFPPEPPRAVTDDRGFPVLKENRYNNGLYPTPPSPSLQRRVNSGGGETDMRTPQHNNESHWSPSPELPPRHHSNLFLSPFSSTLPPETASLSATSRDGNRATWIGRATGRGGLSGAEPPSPPSPARQMKGSHMKLDLLLHEVQRLNSRLDTFGCRLGALEEERVEIEGRGDIS